MPVGPASGASGWEPPGHGLPDRSRAHALEMLLERVLTNWFPAVNPCALRTFPWTLKVAPCRRITLPTTRWRRPSSRSRSVSSVSGERIAGWRDDCRSIVVGLAGLVVILVAIVIVLAL